ncbi:M48 family metallopeptidase [Granulicella sibirica]|uniref:Zn-dependent protease with chaperone function n=1 Tax=Granulicella sibirica TaxID=2479048 RepID=A0A4Q0STD7_9BACT|nr:M48 family metallopeptidase [Granulicella sibirica]RXH54215.1 Zn-dependent protease with chaperone function [Granulicella sibirica]
MSKLQTLDPTLDVSLDFATFARERDRNLSAHTGPGGVADYAYGLDYSLRQKIASIGAARQFVRSIAAATEPIQKHIHAMEMVAVGPRQFPHLHAIGENCARRLGIGIPRIYIMASPELSAYTIATDDVAPMLVLSSELVEKLTEPELLFVVGHECGHVHNLHGAYNTAVQNLTNPLARLICQKMVGLGVAYDVISTLGQARLVTGVVAGALRMFFLSWSRAAEVTCDRAGLICCGDFPIAQTALASLATGGAASLRGINVDAYTDQLNQTRESPVRFLEWFATHPVLPKRIEALKVFTQCDLLYQWRPDLGRPSELKSKAETDSIAAGLLGN